MIIDITNLSIIKHLENGRKSFKEIADLLRITENTVRSRVNKMVDDELLAISALIDPEKIDGLQLIIVGVKLQNMDLVVKGKEISKLKGVVSVNVVTGQYDLIVTVLLKEGFGLLEFYTNEMSKVKNVQSVETFVVYKSYNMKIPYIFE